MKSPRKTGQDYHREFNDLNKSLSSLDAHVTERLMELVRIHPDAIIIGRVMDGDHLVFEDIKAKSLTRNWVEDLPIEQRIQFIQNIEKWSEGQQGVRQLEIED